jgi:hypothetical protein
MTRKPPCGTAGHPQIPAERPELPLQTCSPEPRKVTVGRLPWPRQGTGKPDLDSSAAQPARCRSQGHGSIH